MTLPIYLRLSGFHLRACAVVLLAVSVATACREEDGAVKVASIGFEGNETFNDGTLQGVIVTEAKGILPWARSRYFNRDAFQADLERLRAFYRDRGFPSAAVDGLDVTFNTNRDAVRIRIVVTEGTPLIVERIDVTGLETVGADVAAAVRAMPLKEGERLDRQVLARSREEASFALRDRGFPDAKVEVVDSEGSTPQRRVIRFSATPGESASFGRVAAVGLDNVNAAVVRRTLAFHVGDPYRESEVLESQRRLAALGVFDFAHVARALSTTDAPVPEDAVTIEGPVVAGAVPMRVTVAETKPTRLKVGLGYGTEDGPRGSLNWQHANFLGSARRLSADARYSQRLQNIGFDLVQPYLFSRMLSVRGYAGATWTRELNYSSRRIGGRGSVEYRGRISRGLEREPIQHVIRGSYTNEALQYGIRPETLEDLTQFDQFVALGFDPVTGSGRGRLASLELAFERQEVDRLINPRAGYTLSLQLGRAAPALGGTYDYTEVLTDVRGYVPIADAVVAARLRVGGLMTEDERNVPFSARYFLGGTSSLRGWGRFQVAPLTVDGLPIGGRGLLEASIEARVPLSGNIGAVAFVDAGNVWEDRSQISTRDLRVNVGPGLRYTSPIGVVRADLGYQLTRIDGLVINGAPERRQWRIHLSIGEAF